MVMSRDVFLQDVARLLNGYFFASHQTNQLRGHHYSIMSTFRTHSIEIQNLRTFHFKWDFQPPSPSPPKKKKLKQTLQTPTENIHFSGVFFAWGLNLQQKNTSRDRVFLVAFRLFEGSTLVMKAINANVRSDFFVGFGLGGAVCLKEYRRTHFFGSKCCVGFFGLKALVILWVGPKKSCVSFWSGGDWRTWSIWMHMDKSGNNW